MIDHLVYAVPDLGAGVSRLEGLLGVRAAYGGKHVGLGTHNALLSLGVGVYLEIIAPDPEEPRPERPLPFGLEESREPRLAAWCARPGDLDGTVARARAAGYDPGDIVPGSRRRPDGVDVAWRLSLRQELAGGGIVPFLIDWGSTPHPSESAPSGCALLDLRAEHPRPEEVAKPLAALGIEMRIDSCRAPALIATIQSPRGSIELR